LARVHASFWGLRCAVVGIASFALMQLCFALDAVLIFINFLALDLTRFHGH